MPRARGSTTRGHKVWLWSVNPVVPLNLPSDLEYMCFSFLVGESGGENPCLTGLS